MDERKRGEHAEAARTLRQRSDSREDLNLVSKAIIGGELSRRGLSFQRQVGVPVECKGVKLDCNYRLDLLVEDAVIVEVKALEEIRVSAGEGRPL